MKAPPRSARPLTDAPDLERLPQPASIDTWLNVFTNLMRLPAHKRESIRAELHAHLRERTRDLMLAGANEAEALTTATAELGEAAELAKRFDRADRNPTRRRIMNAAILTIGVGAGMFGIISTQSLNQDAQVSFNVFEEVVSEDPPDWFDEPLVTIVQGASVKSFIDSIAPATDGLIVMTYWDELADCQIEPDYELQLALPHKTSIARSLDLVLRELNAQSGFDRITWWYGDGVLEIGSQHQLDERNTLLASYDVSDTLLDLRNKYGEGYEAATHHVVDLIISFVSPDAWEDNGGIVGHLRIVGGRLFVEAPERMHEKLRWILAELRISRDDIEEAALNERYEELSAVAGSN